MSNDLLNRLVPEFKKLSEQPGFPDNCCSSSAIHMYTLGYGIISGVVRIENYLGSGQSLDILSFWNFDRKTGLDFDMTSLQFNRFLSEEDKKNGRRFPDLAVFRRGEFPEYIEVMRDISPDDVFIMI